MRYREQLPKHLLTVFSPLRTFCCARVAQQPHLLQALPRMTDARLLSVCQLQISRLCFAKQIATQSDERRVENVAAGFVRFHL